MQILYLSRLTVSSSLLIRGFYQPTPFVKVHEAVVKINANFSHAMDKNSCYLSTQLANRRWCYYRRTNHERIYAKDVYQIMTQLKGDLKLDPDFLRSLKYNLASPYTFYNRYLTAFEMD